ncbi:substrate-binding periplasmic protein [Bdellovibrio svalbardensis]|uniref:Transporter substrate-binding domain-containing protein n=1 Tax=Bdellovibrio svalbardensis TaxID=2972972 RepID=A0ABT6DH89_9BACT|nr:transporter substrate-binding domain-containing protein [Bdellovibrio svalbardensis]MDG0815837.1 transporter substrate-binding domain-containing protein [Bdellovibrio svalbardensis]
MKYFRVFALTLLCFGSPAKARYNSPFTFVGQDVEPFYFKEGSVGIQGAVFDIMKEICTQEKLTCKFKIAQMRPALDMIKNGAAHGGGPFAISRQRETVLHYTDPIFKSAFVFLAASETAKKIKSYNDLAGMSAVAMSTSMTWISLQRVNEITGNKMKVSGEPTELTAIRKTENKNYALAYVPRELARAYFQHNRDSNLREIPALGEPFDIYMVFSRKTVSEDDFKKINQIVKALKKSGFIKDLADRYNLEAIPPAN